MSVEVLKKLIREGNVASALCKIKALKDDQLYLKLLIEVYFLTKEHSQYIPSSGDAINDLFELTSILCRRIISGGKFDVAKFSKALHWIVKFFIEKNRIQARMLGEYFIEFGAFNRDTDCQLVAKSFAYEFKQLILKNYLAMIKTVNEDSFEQWMDFIFRLHEAYPLILDELCSFLQRILVNVRNNCKESQVYVAALCLQKFARWASPEARKKLASAFTQTNEKMFENLMLFLKVLFSFLDAADISSMAEELSNFLRGLQQIWTPYQSELELVVTCSDACAAIHNKKNYVKRFDSFFQAFLSFKGNLKTLPTVLTIFICYSLPINKTTDIVEDKIADWSKMFLQCFKQLVARKEALDDAYQLAYCAFTIIFRSPVTKNAMLHAFPTAKIILKHLSSIVTKENYVELKFIHSAVMEMTNALIAYNKVGLSDEFVQLWRHLMPMFLKVGPEMVRKNSRLELCITTWLGVMESSRLYPGVESQVILLVFTSIHPKFTDLAMEVWASFKLSKSKLISMDATVADIFETYRDDVVKQFPDFNPDSLDFNKLLLSEVRAYSKKRDQLNKPIIAVYKTAARIVKDHVYLANILCCVIDALCLSNDGVMYLSSLEKSLVNITAHLQKLEHGKTVEDLPRLLCTLGNLYYMRARLELHRIRKKAEEDELKKAKQGDQSEIVILQENAKDDLDMTIVALMDSPVKLRRQPKTFKFLEQAIKYWTDSESLLAPHPSLATTLSYIKGAGYLCRLYAANDKETLCWDLMYRIAGKLESEEGQLLAVSELLACRQVVPPEFIANIESFLPKIKKNGQKPYLADLYFVSVAKNLFLSGKVDESRKALERLDNIKHLTLLVKVQYRILVALMDMTDPAGGTVSINGQPSYASLLRNVENLMFVVKNGTYETFNEATVVQLLFIGCLALLIVYFTDLSSVRMARCYIRMHASLARRLAAPVRICEITALQCWVDLLTWNTSDTNLNAKEVEKMLEMGVLTEGHNFDSSPSKFGSPRLSSRIKCYPHFLDGSKDCDCVLCRDVHYQILALSSIMIRAKILIGIGYDHDARSVLNVGLSVVEVIKEKVADNNAFWTMLFSPIARFYHFVANSKFVWKKYKEALHYANLAKNLLLAQTAKNRILLGSIERVLLNIQFAENCQIQPIFKPKPVLHVESLPESTTPENKKISKTSIIDNAPAKPTIEETDRKFLESKKSRTIQSLAFGKSSNQPSNLNLPDTAPMVIITPPPIEKLTKGPTAARKPTGKNVLFRSPDKENDSKLGSAFSGTPGISHLVNTATPAINVFYDPEGLESKSTVRRKPKARGDLKLSTSKRVKHPRTAASEKLGTPLLSKTSRTRKLFSAIDPSDCDADIVVPNSSTIKRAGKASDTESGDPQEEDKDTDQSVPKSSGLPCSHLKTAVCHVVEVVEPSGDGSKGNSRVKVVPPESFDDIGSIKQGLETQPCPSNESMNETKVGVTPVALKKVRARRRIINSSMDSIDEDDDQSNSGPRLHPAGTNPSTDRKSRIPKINMGPPDLDNVKKSTGHLTQPKSRRRLDLQKASSTSSQSKLLNGKMEEIEGQTNLSNSSAEESVIEVSPSMLLKVRARRNLLDGTIYPADESEDVQENSLPDSDNSAGVPIGNNDVADRKSSKIDSVGSITPLAKMQPKIGLFKAPSQLLDKERILQIKGQSKMSGPSAEGKTSSSKLQKVPVRRNLLTTSRYAGNVSSDPRTETYLDDNQSLKVNMGPPSMAQAAKPCAPKADKSSKVKQHSTISCDATVIGVTPRTLEKVRARRSPLEDSSSDTQVNPGSSEFSRSKTIVSGTPMRKTRVARGNSVNVNNAACLVGQVDSAAKATTSSKPREIAPKPPKTLDEQLASKISKLALEKPSNARISVKSCAKRAEEAANSATEVSPSENKAFQVVPNESRVFTSDVCSSDSETDVGGIVGPSPPQVPVLSSNRRRILQLTPIQVAKQLNSLSLKTPSSTAESKSVRDGATSKPVRPRKK